MELMNNDCFADLHTYPSPLEQNEAFGGTQFDELPEIDEDSPQTQGQASKPTKTKLSNWTSDEDLILVSAWLNTSLDGATGADQKKTQYWTRVTNLYNEIKEQKEPNLPIRPSVQSRWGLIHKWVGRFKNHYKSVLARPASRFVKDDGLKQARELYLKIEGHTFGFEKCWMVLKNQPKWMDLANLQATKGKSKTSKREHKKLESSSGATEVVDVDLNDSSSPIMFDEAIRPVGRKRAKADQKSEKSQLQEAIRFNDHLRMIEEGKVKDREAKLKLEEKKQEEKQLVREQRKREHEEKMAMETRRQNMLEEQQRMQAERERKQEEKEIMTMDLSALDEESRLYFISRRREILAIQLSRKH